MDHVQIPAMQRRPHAVSEAYKEFVRASFPPFIQPIPHFFPSQLGYDNPWIKDIMSQDAPLPQDVPPLQPPPSVRTPPHNTISSHHLAVAPRLSSSFFFRTRSPLRRL